MLKLTLYLYINFVEILTECLFTPDKKYHCKLYEDLIGNLIAGVELITVYHDFRPICTLTLIVIHGNTVMQLKETVKGTLLFILLQYVMDQISILNKL